MYWHSRHVLSWKLSNTLDTGFCVAKLEEALGKVRPEIFNTYQGAQFTSEAFTHMLQEQVLNLSSPPILPTRNQGHRLQGGGRSNFHIPSQSAFKAWP